MQTANGKPKSNFSFEANMDYDSWTMDYISTDIENQIVKELQKRGIPASKLKSYSFKLVVEVELNG